MSEPRCDRAAARQLSAVRLTDEVVLRFLVYRYLGSVHFLFARAKRKWTKRESTPGEGISLSSFPWTPSFKRQKRGLAPLLKYPAPVQEQSCFFLIRLRGPARRRPKIRGGLCRPCEERCSEAERLQACTTEGRFSRGDMPLLKRFNWGGSREGKNSQSSPPLCRSLSPFLLDKQEKGDCPAFKKQSTELRRGKALPSRFFRPLLHEHRESGH